MRLKVEHESSDLKLLIVHSKEKLEARMARIEIQMRRDEALTHRHAVPVHVGHDAAPAASTQSKRATGEPAHVEGDEHKDERLAGANTLPKHHHASPQHTSPHLTGTARSLADRARSMIQEQVRLCVRAGVCGGDGLAP